MVTRSIKKGQLVISRAGRDKDRMFIICNWDDEFVYVADGSIRLVEKPKKKNINHLWYTQTVAVAISSKLEAGECVTNTEFRHALLNIAKEFVD